jgi:hypothetical protein
MPTVNIAPYIRNQYFTDNGIPLAGGLLNCYNGGSAGGTGDRKDTYSDAAGTTLNANPIVLDAAGRAKIYLKSGPYLFVLTDSTGSVIWSEDGVSNLSVTTSVNTMSDLRALVAGSASIIRTLGYGAINDGGGWWYYWSASSSATHDGGMVIQPSSLPATGRWIGFLPEDREVNLRIFGAVCDGETDVATELTLCEAYCATSDCAIVIDASIYEATNVTITSKVKLLPSAVFLYGNFNPSLKIIIDENDHTQHFSCEVAYIPTLDTDFLYAEWFGETWVGLHPKTTAAIAAATGSRKICDLLYADSLEVGRFYGDLAIDGRLVVGANWIGYDNAALKGMYLNPENRLHIINAPEIKTDISASMLIRDDSSFADSVGGGISFEGKFNTAGDYTPFAGIKGVKEISADGNNAGELQLQTKANGGNPTTRMSISSAGQVSIPIGLSVHDLGAGVMVLEAMADGSLVKVGSDLQIGYSTVAGVTIGQPTGGNKGGGTLNAVAVYDDNVLLTGYVLDKAFNADFDIAEWNKRGKGERHVAACAFEEYSDLALDVDACSKFIETHRMLPSFVDVETSGNIPSTGAMIQKLWEALEVQAVHIKQLNDKIKLLEQK